MHPRLLPQLMAIAAGMSLCLAGFAQDSTPTDVQSLRNQVQVLTELLDSAKARLAEAEGSEAGYALSDRARERANSPNYFRDWVLPVLEESCFECHGSGEQKGGLRLDSKSAALAGGDSGTVIVPGNLTESVLVRAIHRDGELKMPPETELDPQGVEILAAWIAAGAEWPDDVISEPAPLAEDAPDPAETRDVPLATFAITDTGPVKYNRDIRPILANTCYECHGPDEKVRKARLRLDTEEGAYGALPSGRTPVTPGSLDESQIFQRIAAADPENRMPPPGFDKSLTDEQIVLIGQWIVQGAEWEPHWSFVPPVRPALPQVARQEWVRNPIDNFVLARLEDEGIPPSPEAGKRRLIRRVALDLTGLPPTPEDIDAFLNDTSPDAYEKAVDRLLASPHYGEHMARYWLDAARYADTNGYHIDNERYMWRWRDWVIDAFNRNLPFDQFTIEQLAGDLLPDPSFDQKLATGFNRNHMINFEGGAIPEEYRVQYVADRVETTATVWMALTVQCAQCHDHKFDSIKQKEFYEMSAFFNSIPEVGLDGQEGNADPLMKAPLPGQRAALERLDAKIADSERYLNQPDALLDLGQLQWERDWAERLAAKWSVLHPDEVTAEGGADAKVLEDGSVLLSGENPDRDVITFRTTADLNGITAVRLEAIPDESLPGGGTGRADNGNFVLTGFDVAYAPDNAPESVETVPFVQALADHAQDGTSIEQAIDGKADTGWSAEGMSLKERRTAYFIPSGPFGAGENTRFMVRLRHESEYPKRSLGRFRISITTDTSMTRSTFGRWHLNGPYVAESGEEAYATDYGPEETSVDLLETYPDGRKKWLELKEGFEDGRVHNLDGEVAATYLYRVITAPSAREMVLALGSNDAIKVWLNGEVVHDNNVQRGITEGEDKVTLNLRDGKNSLLMKIVNYGATYAFSFAKEFESLGAVPFEIEVALSKPGSVRTENEQQAVRTLFRSEHSTVWLEEKSDLDALIAERKELNDNIPVSMIMSELDEPRETFVLERGLYDRQGEEVKRGTPDALPPFPDDAPLDRLGFAKWLVHPDHPLTARVAVNRMWQRFFGTGIVATTEDFGAQGEWPSHPELLDWLATEFIKLNWDMKAFQKEIVTSATYRQSSRIRPEVNAVDPENRLLARGPRYRLDAEMIRDNALAVSGLLVRKIGGPSVKPYQPEGLWKEVGYASGRFTASIFEQDEGDALYRRSMYTFWKRTSPPPSMMIFDAPNRETCSVRRSRANTPLQALALLNDPQFVEAARTLAERMLTEGGDTKSRRIAYAFELATARRPTERECDLLLRVLDDELHTFAGSGSSATQLIEVGDSAPADVCDPVELAAYTNVASIILNLDETITKS